MNEQTQTFCLRRFLRHGSPDMDDATPVGHLVLVRVVRPVVVVQRVHYPQVQNEPVQNLQQGLVTAQVNFRLLTTTVPTAQRHWINTVALDNKMINIIISLLHKTLVHIQHNTNRQQKHLKQSQNQNSYARKYFVAAAKEWNSIPKERRETKTLHIIKTNFLNLFSTFR